MPVFLALALIIGIWFGSKLQSRKSASLPILMNNGNKLSLIMSLIENNYVDYPICIMKHIEKGVRQDIIEIRFDEQTIAGDYCYTAALSSNQ